MKKVGIILFFLLLRSIESGNVFASFLHAPHDEAHGVSCVNCHAFPFSDLVSWEVVGNSIDDTVRNIVCLNCHGSQGSAPTMATHSDLVMNGTETWGVECTACHDPHFQAQLAGVAGSGSAIYRVTGAIDSVVESNGATIISYTLDFVAPEWADPNKWGAKTGVGRGMIFVADALNPKGVTYEVLSADAATIAVAGSVNPANVGKNFGILYGQLLRSSVKTLVGERAATFLTPAGGFVDTSATTTPTGICQVCHRYTAYWTNDGGNTGHNPVADCTACHPHTKGFAPTVSNSGKHSAHLALAGVGCGTCHNTANFPFFKSGVDADGDGRFNLAETDVCNVCHQNGAGGAALDVKAGWTDENFVMDCGSCHASSPASGSHVVHDASLTDCGGCHDGAVAGTVAPAQHLDQNVDVYDNNPGDLGYPTDKVIASAYTSCSSTYCHSSAQGTVNPVNPPVYATTPAWGTPFGNTVTTCKSCHNSGGHVGGQGTPMASGSHAKHLNFKFDQSGTCQACHFDPDSTGCTGCHQVHADNSMPARHVNKSIDVVFSPEFPFGSSASSGFYSGDPAPQNAYGSCDSLYCHSPGTKASAPYDSPNVTSITWGGNTLPADCTGCHDGDSDAAVKMGTGSHSKHIVSADCSMCHSYTVTDSRTLNQTPYSTYTYGRRYHVDGQITLAFSSTIANNALYAGLSTPQLYKAAGSAYGSCSNIYCHSDGTSVATTAAPVNTTPVWGGSGLTCDSCHSYPPAYANGTPKANSHDIHGGFGCNACHFTTTNTGDTISGAANHANKVYDVQAGDGVSFGYSFNAAGSTCSNISCHGGSGAVWGAGFDHSTLITVGSTVCANCHSDPPPLVAAADPKVHNDCASCHDANGTLISLAAGKSAPGDCTTCHGNHFPNHTHHSSLNNGLSYDAAVDTSQLSQEGCAECHHDYDLLNGSTLGLSSWATILLEHDTDGVKDGSASTCDNCHAYDGSKTAPLAAVQAAIASSAAVTCATCHIDKVPAVGHGGHSDADFGYDGAAGCGECHSGPVVSAVHGGNCNICHVDPGGGNFERKIGATTFGIDGDATLSASRTDTCLVCHPAAVYPAMEIHHVSRNNYAENGECVQCHGADSAADHGALVTVGTTTCGNCHSDPPPLVDAANPKAHNSCGTCHDATGSLVSLAVGKSFAAGGDCSTCHTSAFDVIHPATADHSGYIVRTGPECVGCHTNPALVDPVDPKTHSNCTTCHDAGGGLVSIAVPNGGACLTCHTYVGWSPMLQFHPVWSMHHYLPGGYFRTEQIMSTSCATCHINIEPGEYPEGADPFVVLDYEVVQIHNNTCSGCHTDNGLFGSAEGKFGGGICWDCHTGYDASFSNHKPPTHFSLRETEACYGCHDGANIIFDTHKNNCLSCHIDLNSGLLRAGSKGDATGGAGECIDCHGADFPSIHTVVATVDHTSIVTVGTTGCGSCHSDPPPLVDAANPKVHNSCASCHDANGSLLSLAAGKSFAAGGDCATCHTAGFSVIHTHAHTGISTTTTCGTSGCHAQIDIVGAIHLNNCDSCHFSAVPVVQAAINSGTAQCSSCHLNGGHTMAEPYNKCADCHQHTSIQYGNPRHQMHVNRLGGNCSACHNRPDPICLSCHFGTDNSLHNKHDGEATCLECHTTIPPGTWP